MTPPAERGRNRWSLAAPALLAAARARRSRARWLWPALGLAVAVAAGGSLAAEATIAGDQAARRALGDLTPLARSIRVTWQGPVTPGAANTAVEVLSRVSKAKPTRVLLLNPVRLSGRIVRPAAIAPLAPWLERPPGRLAPCRPRACPMLLAAGGPAPAQLRAAGVHLLITGRDRLTSQVPLGFSARGDGSWPLLLTSDARGLDGLGGLSGLYRVHSWVAPLTIAGLHSWELGKASSRLTRAQATLLQASTQFSLDAPFAGIDAARAAARSAPAQLELVGGGAIVVIGLFVLLAAAGLGPEQRAELGRLAVAGATRSQAVAFVVCEAALLSAVGVLIGAAASIALAALLAAVAGEPVSAVLAHSVLTPTAALVGGGGWLAAAAILSCTPLVPRRRLLDLAGLAGAVLLVGALVLAPSSARLSSTPALAPLYCLAAGAIVFRAATLAFAGLERVARDGPVTLRLALLGLARRPNLPAFAVAFTALSVAVGGFALSYHATLARGALDQAAARVPLDALISPSASFRTPLELAPLARWRLLARGDAFPVRDTEATYASGDGSVTEPALGVAAAALPLIHGWRSSDGSAPLRTLARRLRPRGATRTPGPRLPPGARRLSILASSPAVSVTVVAILRDPAGAVRRLVLGQPTAAWRRLGAPLPRGTWELEALEIDESTALELTNGHQNGENPAAATQSSERLRLGALRWSGDSGSAAVSLAGWRAVGALSSLAGGRAHAAGRSGAIALRFEASGFPGVLRPVQPSDLAPIPVLTDRATAAVAGAGGRLALTIDELPVQARVAGVLRRFPTVSSGSAGFVIADEAALSAALDAQLPGQGQPDALWVKTTHPGALQGALGRGRFAELGSSFRQAIARKLSSAPVARAVSHVLLAAAALAAILASIGLLLAVLGPLRDRRLELELEEQGLGPRALRRELLARLGFTTLLGAGLGVALAAALGALTVRIVDRTIQGAARTPPLVAIVPWPALVVSAVAFCALLLSAGAIATRLLFGERRPAGRRSRPVPGPATDARIPAR